MAETIRLGELVIALARKSVKHVHLSVHPPRGRVSLVVPVATRVEVARAYAISKLGWIREQQSKLRGQARETPRRYVTRESHYLWGRRYLLSVVEEDGAPRVTLSHRSITLRIRPRSSRVKREAIIHAWHKALLHKVVPSLIRKWEAKIDVRVDRYFLQRMKTKWGSSNPGSRTIRLNTELVKKPRDLLDYIVLHEIAHFIEPRHGERFVKLLDMHYPSWRTARAELNELPVAAEAWKT
jgi:predicted metal-dependent hydrolase